MNFEITKMKKIKEINNDMIHSYYYLVYGRLYTGDHRRYLKIKYVMYFDVFDIQEYFDKERITQANVKEYLRVLAYSNISYYIGNITSELDKNGIKALIEYCNNTIKEYNEMR